MRVPRRRPDPPLSTEDVLAAELEAWQSLRHASSTPNRDGDVKEQLHRAQPAALCLSGGGIRSATFGLGVLQGLARKGLLEEFDYISTVSGGWLQWVYLSDGGHFENLGLYEMVRRRCHTIVVSDAGRDPKITFEDLGNAIRKIRIDLGIPVTIGDVKIYPRGEQKPGRYYAIGTIHHDVVDPGAPQGVIVYSKPSIYGKEPIDIRNYASQNVEFPHESTSDQWFTESQFESYRALGAFVIDDICGKLPVESLTHFVDRLKSQREEASPEPRLGIRKPPGPEPSIPAPMSTVVG